MSRDLRILVAAALVGAFGDFAAFVALWTQVHDRTHSGAAVAALFIALWGPLVACAGWAGRLVDRVESRRVLIVASLVQAAAAGALALTTSLGPLLALVALLGCAGAVAQPAD